MMQSHHCTLKQHPCGSGALVAMAPSALSAPYAKSAKLPCPDSRLSGQKWQQRSKKVLHIISKLIAACAFWISATAKKHQKNLPRESPTAYLAATAAYRPPRRRFRRCWPCRHGSPAHRFGWFGATGRMLVQQGSDIFISAEYTRRPRPLPGDLPTVQNRGSALHTRAQHGPCVGARPTGCWQF